MFLLDFPVLFLRKVFNINRSCQLYHQARAKLSAKHALLTL